MKSAYTTIKGFAVMCVYKQGKARLWQNQDGIAGEVRPVERSFAVAIRCNRALVRG